MNRKLIAGWILIAIALVVGLSGWPITSAYINGAAGGLFISCMIK